MTACMTTMCHLHIRGVDRQAINLPQAAELGEAPHPHRDHKSVLLAHSINGGINMIITPTRLGAKGTLWHGPQLRFTLSTSDRLSPGNCFRGVWSNVIPSLSNLDGGRHYLVSPHVVSCKKLLTTCNQCVTCSVQPHVGCTLSNCSVSTVFSGFPLVTPKHRGFTLCEGLTNPLLGFNIPLC